MTLAFWGLLGVAVGVLGLSGRLLWADNRWQVHVGSIEQVTSIKRWLIVSFVLGVVVLASGVIVISRISLVIAW